MRALPHADRDDALFDLRATERDASLLCVVESPSDVVAIEQSGSYKGRYFVLMGHLSPLDRVGPEELGVRELTAILAEGGVRELILATNPTVEGEATAHFLGEIAASHGVRASRIAHGVPIGGELEYVDGGTLAHALCRPALLRLTPWQLHRCRVATISSGLIWR